MDSERVHRAKQWLKHHDRQGGSNGQVATFAEALRGLIEELAATNEVVARLEREMRALCVRGEDALQRTVLGWADTLSAILQEKS